MKKFVACLGVFAIALTTGAPQATTIAVPGDQPSLQAAVDVALSGDTVLVAPGNYSGPGNRDISLLGKKLVVTSSSGPTLTTIDCESAGRAFVANSGEPSGTEVNGFTIVNGFGPGGGAIYVSSSHLQVRHCIIQNCSVSVPGEDGGAILVDGGLSALYVSNCRIQGNSANRGGGICLRGTQVGATIDTTLIAGNYAESGVFSGVGGGICLRNGTASAYLLNCTVAGNLADFWGGGIAVSTSGVLTLELTVVSGNEGFPSFTSEMQLGSPSYALAYCLATDPTKVDGTISGIHVTAEDPGFCDPESGTNSPTTDGNYSIDSSSFLATADTCSAIQGLGTYGHAPIGCPITTGIDEATDQRNEQIAFPTIVRQGQYVDVDVDGPGDSDVTVSIYSIGGRLVAEQVGRSPSLSFRIPVLAPGVYFARISPSGGSTSTHRFILLH